MCSTGWGLQCHSCPITPRFINLFQLACMESLFCSLVLVVCLPATQVVCISGCTSLGCVWGNEMALPVMYLAFSPVAEAVCVSILIFHPSRAGYIGWQKEWEVDCWSWLMFVLWISTTHLITENEVLFSSVAVHFSPHFPFDHFFHRIFFFTVVSSSHSLVSYTSSSSRWRPDICKCILKRNKTLQADLNVHFEF